MSMKKVEARNRIDWYLLMLTEIGFEFDCLLVLPKKSEDVAKYPNLWIARTKEREGKVLEGSGSEPIIAVKNLYTLIADMSIESKEGEVWKKVDGYEYEVSNYARVRSTSRYSRKKMLIPSPNKSGYLRVQLHRDEIRKQFYLHRLVAMYFVDNPDSKEYVNHIDSNLRNNVPSNLEWCTQQENVAHSIKYGKRKMKKK